jgi:hypothetical protein
LIRFQFYLGLLQRFSLPITFLLWLVAITARLIFNGGILGFDYAIYQPDGANYTFRTLSFLSENNIDASNKVSEWYAVHGFKHNIFDPKMLLPENSPVWHLSAPRVLYPILSIPFVAILGIPGMLVIPALALLGILLISHFIAKTVERPELALLFNVIIVSSSTVSRWFVANLTDSLLAFLIGLLVLVEIKTKELKNWIPLVVFIVLLASATRFSVPIFLALSLAYLLLREIIKALTLFIASISGAVPLLFFDSTSAVLPGSTGDSMISKLVNLPIQSVKVLVVEIGQLVVLDRIFFILVILSLFCAYQLRGKVAILTAGVFVGVLAVGFINGTLGVNFRYQLPLISYMGWGLIYYLKFISTPAAR